MSNSTFFHSTNNLFLYKNVDLVHSYIQISQPFIEMLYSYKDMSILTYMFHSYIQVSHYYIQMSQFYIAKSHPYIPIRDSYIDMSADLTKGSFRHFSRFCVIKISKTSKFFQDFACSYNRVKLFLTCNTIKGENISDKIK